MPIARINNVNTDAINIYVLCPTDNGTSETEFSHPDFIIPFQEFRPIFEHIKKNLITLGLVFRFIWPTR